MKELLNSIRKALCWNLLVVWGYIFLTYLFHLEGWTPVSIIFSLFGGGYLILISRSILLKHKTFPRFKLKQALFIGLELAFITMIYYLPLLIIAYLIGDFNQFSMSFLLLIQLIISYLLPSAILGLSNHGLHAAFRLKEVLPFVYSYYYLKTWLIFTIFALIISLITIIFSSLVLPVFAMIIISFESAFIAITGIIYFTKAYIKYKS